MGFRVVIKDLDSGEIVENMKANSFKDAQSIKSGVLIQGLGEHYGVFIESP